MAVDYFQNLEPQQTFAFLPAFSQATQLGQQMASFPLEQQLRQVQAQYAAPEAQAQLALQQAQAKRENVLANLPFGGQSLPGVAGQIAGLETVRQLYGENSPQFQLAQQSYNLGLMGDVSRINYQNALTGTMPVRYLTPTGKAMVEQTRVAQGEAPTGQGWQSVQSAPPSLLQNLPMSNTQINQLRGLFGQQPAQSQQSVSNVASATQQPQSATAPLTQQPPSTLGNAQNLADQYALIRQKAASDPQARQKTLFATNIDKTLDMINPDDLLQYSGIPGHVKLASDTIQSALGNASPQYTNYKNSLTAATALATQVRQFYGDSIQPSMIQRLEILTNPSSWTNSPQLAKSMFEETKNILNNETQTYRDALKSQAPYQKNANVSQMQSGNADPLGIR